MIVVCVLYSFVCSTFDLDSIEWSKPGGLFSETENLDDINLCSKAIVITYEEVYTGFLSTAPCNNRTLRCRRAQEEPLLAERESERQARRYQAWSAAPVLVVAQ